MQTSDIIRQLLMGLTSGLVTFMMAAGVSIVISGLNIVNFGQGAFFMLGAMLCWFFYGTVGFWWAMVLGVIIIAILGALAEFLLRPLYGKSMMYQMLMTMGIGFVIIDGMQFLWGRDVKMVLTPSYLSGSIDMLGAAFPVYRIFIMVIAVLFALGLWYMFNKTKLGMIFRAIISNRSMVGCLGINVTLLFAVMFMVGTGLSGVAGVLMAPIMGIDAQSSMDVMFSVMTVLMIGGLTSMNGALYSALLVGVINAYGSMFVPQYYNLIPGFIMIIVLLVKPQGLFVSEK